MKCPLCTSTRIKQYHDRVWSIDNGSVHYCETCSLTFISPIMSDTEEKEFYAKYNEHASRRGFTVSKTTEELHEKSKPIAHARFDVIKDFFASARHVLEIGTSSGAFLELLKGKDCYGVELTDDNRNFSKKFCVGVFADIREVPDQLQLDIICMFHTFEHIKEPFEFLALCKSHLNSNGKIIIEVPCIEDPLLSLYDCKAYKDFYFQPMHPYIYSERSLDYVFSKAGFRKGLVLFYQRYGLDNHLTWLSKGNPGGDPLFRELFGNNVDYTKTLEKQRKTDTLFYMAGK